MQYTLYLQYTHYNSDVLISVPDNNYKKGAEWFESMVHIWYNEMHNKPYTVHVLKLHNEMQKT